MQTSVISTRNAAMLESFLYHNIWKKSACDSQDDNIV